jgi:transposase
MYRKISCDVTLAAINLHECQHLPLEDILACVGFSESTFWRILRLWQETGDVIQHTHGVRGRPRILHCDDVSYLIRLVHHRPEWFLDELLRLLDTNRFISVHYTTIHRELERVGVSLKKLKRIAKERNEERRMDFLIRMSQYSPEQLGFLDETSKHEHTTGRLRGRAARGQHACNRQVFVRGQRVSALGLLTVDGMAASSVVEGSFTTVKYLEFLQSTVVRH